MLYHYALLPDIFLPELLTKRSDVRFILKQLLHDLCENGLIANLHENAWVDHLREKLLPNMPPQIKKDVQDLLEELQKRNRLVTCAPCGRGKPGCPEEWLEAAIDVHNQNGLHRVVLTQSLIEYYGWKHETFKELSEALDVPRWLERPRSLTVSMQYPDYETALKPVLQYARTLDLIDPYMNCRKPRFLNVVHMCAGLLGKGRCRATSRRITIHAGDPGKDDETPASRLDAWEDALRPLVDADVLLRFHVCLWSDANIAEDLHDRFIITDQCCISVPRGLDTRPATTPWSLLDESIRREQLKKFSATSAAYTRLGERVIAK